MHIAVFQVLRPTKPSALLRLGRQYTLGFEGTMLTVIRSGPIRPSSVHVERFGSAEELLTNVREKIQRRFQHEYTLVWWTEDFTLLEWIKEHDWLIEPRIILVPGIQLELPFDESNKRRRGPAD